MDHKDLVKYLILNLPIFGEVVIIYLYKKSIFLIDRTYFRIINT